MNLTTENSEQNVKAYNQNLNKIKRHNKFAYTKALLCLTYILARRDTTNLIELNYDMTGSGEPLRRIRLNYLQITNLNLKVSN